MDILKSSPKEDRANAFIPDDQTLGVMFEAAKADKIQKVKHGARQGVIIGGLLIIVSVILFASHWLWVNRQTSHAT